MGKQISERQKKFISAYRKYWNGAYWEQIAFLSIFAGMSAGRTFLTIPKEAW